MYLPFQKCQPQCPHVSTRRGGVDFLNLLSKNESAPLCSLPSPGGIGQEALGGAGDRAEEHEENTQNPPVTPDSHHELLGQSSNTCGCMCLVPCLVRAILAIPHLTRGQGELLGVTAPKTGSVTPKDR